MTAIRTLVFIAALAPFVGSVTACTRLEASSDTAPVVEGRAASSHGGSTRGYRQDYTGVGWSTAEDTGQAVFEAVTEAWGGGTSGLTLLFYTPHHDPNEVVKALDLTGHRALSFGMTTHEGILTPAGYYDADTGVVGALAIDLSGLTTGIGAATLGVDSAAEAGREALRLAVAAAGKTVTERPSLLIAFSTLRYEEEILRGIADEIGSEVPLIGGTAAGMVSAMERRTANVASSMIHDGRVVANGVVVAALYAPMSFSTSFGGGFARGSGKGGVITSSDARLIKTIDGRPAVDVYDEWLGGRMSEARSAGKNVQNFLAFYPLVQTVTADEKTHNQFIRAWPADQAASPGSLITGANVHDGEMVYTSEGSENILVNRFASLPRQARKLGGDKPATAGLFFYCAGALQTIPREHRGVLAALVQKSMGAIPWIGLFTWGEQASVPGIGYQHGNLMASTVLFPLATSD